MIEFINYNGKYPTLCFGTLEIKVNGKPYRLINILTSGGVCRYDNGKKMLTQGNWHLNECDLEMYYPELVPLKKEIEKVVNDNVEKGCCGGCF